jgi:hypothetical protein
MRTRTIVCSFSAFLVAAFAFAQAPEITPAVRHDVSPALRTINIPHPLPGPGREAPEPKRLFGAPDNVKPGAPDPALQTATVASSATLTSPTSFDGVGVPNYSVQYAPPDTNGAVGSTQYVQWVNIDFAVFDKATNTMLPGFPKPGKSIWAGFGGYCEQYDDGDPIVQWDKAAQRWILTQFAVSQGAAAGYRQCVAVSTSADATGTYNRYEFSYGTNFNDYPKVGVGTDGNYYITFNMFKRGRTFAGGQTCAYNGAAMRAGTAATQACYNLGTSIGGLLPADIDGAPPYRVTDEYIGNFGSNSLNLWKFHADFATSTFSLTGPTTLPVAAFSKACGGGTCVPQKGTSNQLDSLADRLMYRFARRQFATYDAYVVNHSVASNSVSAVRWYELRTNTNLTSPTVYQQGTYQPDSTHRWMGSIAMDKNGNIVVGYSKSSSTMFPDIFYTARTPADPLGTMPNGEVNLTVTPGGSQTGTLHRWGDYSSLSLDPADDCTMWYTTEYLQTNGTWNWSTRIGKIKPPGCP